VPEHQPPSGRTSTDRPLLLDLFSGAGGAAMGYARAGFHVFGVDKDPQPHYPFEFHRGDAIHALYVVLAGDFEPDVIHASPPCQAYSDLQKQNKRDYPALIEEVRELLEDTGLPYVIENVDGAPLRDPVTLCGTMFPGLRVIRHRLFEANWPLVAPPHRRAGIRSCSPTTSARPTTGSSTRTPRSCRSQAAVTARSSTPATRWASAG
jgi:DNA (cytosine-5)-methyltransferase 1